MTMLKNPARALRQTKTTIDCFQMMLDAATKHLHGETIQHGTIPVVDPRELEYMMDMLIEMVGGYLDQEDCS